MRLVHPDTPVDSVFSRELNALLDALDLQDEQGPVGSRVPGRRVAAATIRWGHSLHGSFNEKGKAYATDISPYGIGLMAEHAFEEGDEILVDLHAVVGKPMLAEGEVVYCRRVLPTMYRVGVHFEHAELNGPFPFEDTQDQDHDDTPNVA